MYRFVKFQRKLVEAEFNRVIFVFLSPRHMKYMLSTRVLEINKMMHMMCYTIRKMQNVYVAITRELFDKKICIFDLPRK